MKLNFVLAGAMLALCACDLTQNLGGGGGAGGMTSTTTPTTSTSSTTSSSHSASCTDGVQDGNETDVDCGGGTCPACADGEKCQVDTDCLTNACDAEALVCVASQCSDHRQDGNETDVDCGGTDSCARCATGQKCTVDSDCVTGDGCVENVCQTGTTSSCTDGIQDGNETDVDCGGSCPPCATGKKCQASTDCTSGDCVANVCQSGTTCAVDSDCTSGDGCLTGGDTCVPSCQDAHQDGNETDVDCGGADSCARCATGKKCQVDSDCLSNACDGVTLVCVANQCSDHRVDGNETDVDCGGTDSCPRCTTGQKCLVDSDCTGGSCVENACQ